MIRTCPKCGAEVYNDICPNCYTKLPPVEQSSKQSVSYTSQQEYSQHPDSSVYYTNQGSNPAAAPSRPQADPSDYKMGWHKFMIYFSLWITALTEFYNCAICFQYNLPVYGLLYLAVVVFTVYTRFQLARFKQGAPTKVMILAVAVLLANLVLLELGDEMDATTFYPLFWGVVNWRYYTKRAELFVN